MDFFTGVSEEGGIVLLYVISESPRRDSPPSPSLSLSNRVSRPPLPPRRSVVRESSQGIRAETAPGLQRGGWQLNQAGDAQQLTTEPYFSSFMFLLPPPICPGEFVPHTPPSCWRDPSHGVPYQLADPQLLYIIKQQDRFPVVSVFKPRLLLGLWFGVQSEIRANTSRRG
jgi:hypothetical protein